MEGKHAKSRPEDTETTTEQKLDLLPYETGVGIEDRRGDELRRQRFV
jgi:hypothetical protein